jgi:hypothetical protein
MSFNALDKQYDNNYIADISPFLPRTITYGFDAYSNEKKSKVAHELEDWKLIEDQFTGYKYYTHPFSNLKFGVLRMHFRDKTFIEVPKYNADCDDPGNSGYKIVKENGKERKVYLSELTYIINSDGIVAKNKMEDFFQTRRGKRFHKYQEYRRKRHEKKRVYAQENSMKIKQ